MALSPDAFVDVLQWWHFCLLSELQNAKMGYPVAPIHHKPQECMLW